jgi:hypothetical protein
MMYQRKQQMREKHLKVPPGWILGTIQRELNLFEHNGTLDDSHDEHDKALTYWRQNRQQYPPDWIWDKYYYDLLFKSFESMHELRAWCEAWEKQLKDLMYLEEQRKQHMKAEEEKRLHKRPNNRGCVRHLKLGNITRPNRQRRTDMLERLTLGVRPLRHGHRHDHRQVIFLHYFFLRS